MGLHVLGCRVDILGTNCYYKFGKNGISSSRPLKPVKTEWGLWTFVNFVFQSAREKTISLVRNCIPQDRTVVIKIILKNCCVRSHRTHLLSVLTDRVCRPLAIIRVAPLYLMCRRVAYLCVAFPHHIANFEGHQYWCRFSSPFSSNVVVCGHHLVTWSLRIKDTLKGLSSLPILMQESFWRWQYSDWYGGDSIVIGTVVTVYW